MFPRTAGANFFKTIQIWAVEIMFRVLGEESSSTYSQTPNDQGSAECPGEDAEELDLLLVVRVW